MIDQDIVEMKVSMGRLDERMIGVASTLDDIKGSLETLPCGEHAQSLAVLKEGAERAKVVRRGMIAGIVGLIGAAIKFLFFNGN